MMKILRAALLKLIDDIDAGNSNLSEDLLEEALQCIKKFTDKDKFYNRTTAARYIRVSVATFDNYRKIPGFPKGHKDSGGVTLWTEKELDEGILIVKKMLLK